MYDIIAMTMSSCILVLGYTHCSTLLSEGEYWVLTDLFISQVQQTHKADWHREVLCSYTGNPRRQHGVQPRELSSTGMTFTHIVSYINRNIFTLWMNTNFISYPNFAIVP